MARFTKGILSEYFIKSNYVIDRHASSNYKITSNFLNVHNLIFVYDGKGTFTKNGKKIQVSRGDLCFFERGCSRILETDKKEPLKMYTINFVIANISWDSTCENFNFELPEIKFDFVKKIANEHTFKKMTQLCEKLINLYLIKNGDGFAKRSVEHEILSLFTDLHENDKYNYAGKKLTDKAITFMSEHLSEKINLEKISEHCKTSPSHLGKMFREVTGMSTIDYLIKMRIEKAKVLLESGLSVTQVSAECGFSDVYYFSSCFKKNEKISPLQYLKIANEEIKNDRYV